MATTAYRIQITDRSQIRRFAEEIGFCAGSIKQLRLHTDILPVLCNVVGRVHSNFDTLPATAWPMLNVAAGGTGDIEQPGSATHPAKPITAVCTGGPSRPSHGRR